MTEAQGGGSMLKWLDHLEEWLIAFLMGAATLVIFVAVVHRYAAGVAIPGVQDFLIRIDLSWAQELCIYMFVWMAKFGAAYGVRTGIHVGVDVLVNNLPEKLRLRFILFGLLAGAFFTAVIGTFGVRFVYALAHSDQTSPDLEMPMWIVYLGNAGIIFAILVALMLTGMPISISLGLTVLVFIFTMTKVPIESIGLKLFTGIEKFEIMAVPFFILAGNFLTHGGVARRMINFATSMGGHFHGGPPLPRNVAGALFALVCRASVGTAGAIRSL